MTHRVDKSFSKWRAGYTSCEQCCTSAYNTIQKLQEQIDSLKWSLDYMIQKYEKGKDNED